MLALVRRADGEALTVHQTFLAADGHGKAPIDQPRLFPAGGNPQTGAVWFGKPDPEREFLVAEGIESLLAAMPSPTPRRVLIRHLRHLRRILTPLPLDDFLFRTPRPGAPPCPPAAFALSSCRLKRGGSASSPTMIGSASPPLATPIDAGGRKGARCVYRRQTRTAPTPMTCGWGS
jgi:hypothetical protein